MSGDTLSNFEDTELTPGEGDGRPFNLYTLTKLYEKIAGADRPPPTFLAKGTRRQGGF